MFDNMIKKKSVTNSIYKKNGRIKKRCADSNMTQTNAKKFPLCCLLNINVLGNGVGVEVALCIVQFKDVVFKSQ